MYNLDVLNEHREKKGLKFVLDLEKSWWLKYVLVL
jgi:hypothetical protein